MNLPLLIAFRHLKAPKRGSFSTFAGLLAILGLGLGVTALILTLSILEGFEQTLSEKIAGFDGHLRIQHFLEQPLPDSGTSLEQVLTDSPVPLKAHSYIQRPALVRKGSRAEGVIVEGLDRDHPAENLARIIDSGTGDLLPGSIIIGRTLAENLDIQLGGDLVLMDLATMSQLSTARRMKALKIVGLFHSGLQEYDRAMVYMSISDAQTLFGMQDQITGKAVILERLDQLPVLDEYLDQSLGYPYYALTWKEKHQVLFDWLDIQRWPILINFGLIALVGLVNIVSALAMIVIEKGREIGILMSMGLTRKRVRYVFLLEGLVIGGAGTFVGALLASVLALIQNRLQILSIPEDIYFMDHVPVQMNWEAALTVIAIGLGVTVLAALIPTLRTGKTHPATLLSYE